MCERESHQSHGSLALAVYRHLVVAWVNRSQAETPCGAQTALVGLEKLHKYKYIPLVISFPEEGLFCQRSAFILCINCT